MWSILFQIRVSRRRWWPNLPIFIPDAACHEGTAVAGKLGAQEMIDWYRAHMGAIRIEPTDIFQREMTSLETQGKRLSRDLHERAALEIVRTYPLGIQERAFLLSDDRDAERLSIVDFERLILLTTWDYLRQLEEAQRIQSADAVMAAVREAGRMPAARDLWSQHDPDVRDAVTKILGRSSGGKGSFHP